MGLSCECEYEWDGEGYCYTDTIETELTFFRRKRCCSCKNLIENKTPILEFCRGRAPLSEVEEKIYGEDEMIDIASYYMCETCSDLYSSLDELGYCVSPTDNMHDLVIEYQELKADGY